MKDLSNNLPIIKNTNKHNKKESKTDKSLLNILPIYMKLIRKWLIL